MHLQHIIWSKLYDTVPQRFYSIFETFILIYIGGGGGYIIIFWRERINFPAVDISSNCKIWEKVQLITKLKKKSQNIWHLSNNKLNFLCSKKFTKMKPFPYHGISAINHPLTSIYINGLLGYKTDLNVFTGFYCTVKWLV